MKRRLSLLAALFALLVVAVVPATAVEPDEILADPALEQRARDISAGLRCMVCQNQSIDDSNAALARDLRILVRDRLQAGDSNEEVVDYIVSRYGEFVLLKPRFSSSTVALWLAPILVLFFGLVAIVMFLRDRRTATATPRLSAAERAEIDEVLRQRRRPD